MHVSYSGDLLNELKTGAIQCVRGELLPYMAGLWQPQGTDFGVYLPFNDEGTVIGRKIDEVLAININGHKVCDLILDKWKNNELGSDEIENMSILDLLVKIDVASNNNGTVNFNNNILYSNPTPPQNTDIIDITNLANPRSEKKEKDNG